MNKMACGFSELQEYVRYCRGLHRFLGSTLTLPECERIVADRLKNRERLFLYLLERISEDEGSPYMKLLDAAGISMEDVEARVSSVGLEKTLKFLAEKGVYLTVDEFKGRADCVRNGRSFRFKESDFDNKLDAGFTSRSGGTRSRGTPVYIDFKYLEETAPHTAVFLAVHGLSDKPSVIWFPAGLGLMLVLSNAKIGKTPLRWFSQVDWTFQIGNKPFGKTRDRVLNVSTWGVGLTRRFRLPRPEYVPFEETERIVDYFAALLKDHPEFCVRTYPSSALRAAKIAVEKGKDLTGVHFIVGGEPVTEAKKREIESSGAKVIAVYASMEAGNISCGCAKPKASDDTHLITDAVALIQCRRKVAKFGIEVNSSLITTLLPHASKMLLNAEMGDTAVLEKRSCGCGFEKIGFTDHLHTIRSFEKLTGEGMTILNSDLMTIVEEVLPRKFGGSMTDYQILEEEDEKGFTKINLLISPEIRGLDEKEALAVICEELRGNGKAGGSSGLSVDIWEKAGTIKIRREYPKRTPVGKMFSFQVVKQKAP